MTAFPVVIVRQHVYAPQTLFLLLQVMKDPMLTPSRGDLISAGLLRFAFSWPALPRAFGPS